MASTTPDIVADAVLTLLLTGEAALRDLSAGDGDGDGNGGEPGAVDFGVDHYGNVWVYLCDGDPAETGANKVAELPSKAVALNSKQTLTLEGAPDGGTFSVTFNAEETGPIAYNASAADVVSALEALSGIGPGNVVATGGPLNTTPVVVEFIRDFRWQTVAALVLEDNNLTNGSDPTVDIETDTVEGMSLLTAFADANGEIERETDTNADVEFGEASGSNTATHLAWSATDDATGFFLGTELVQPVAYENGQPVKISAGNLRLFARGDQ